MAGQALLLQLSLQRDIKRRVGIVAVQAATQLEMFFSVMAHTAFGDIVLDSWSVSRMTFETVDGFFMCGAGCFNFSGLLVMAFDAVLNTQCG